MYTFRPYFVSLGENELLTDWRQSRPLILFTRSESPDPTNSICLRIRRSDSSQVNELDGSINLHVLLEHCLGHSSTTFSMAFPHPQGLLPSEVAFLCEMELVTVVPRQRLERLDLLGVR